MLLRDHIREVGVEVFARRFKITIRSATAYMYGTRLPRPKLAKSIVKRTPVDWVGIYDQPDRTANATPAQTSQA